MQDYLACVQGVDDNVGKVLDYLDETGLAKNTIVIYSRRQWLVFSATSASTTSASCMSRACACR